MSRAGVDFKSMKAELMQDEQFREEYEKLRPRYEIISRIIEVRKEQNMTQEQLARKIGTCLLYTSFTSPP